MGQKIRLISTGIDEGSMWEVGSNNVTEIRATTKPGLHADMPYVQVWKGEELAAEYCQHNITGVYYETADHPIKTPA